MKMDDVTFETLRRDFMAVVNGVQTETGKPLDYTNVRTMWAVFHYVHACRHYDDTHPMWAERKRHVPYVGHAQDHEAFYRVGLNDNHILTALKKIGAM